MNNHQKVYASNYGASKAYKQSSDKRKIGMKNSEKGKFEDAWRMAFDNAEQAISKTES